MIKPPEEMTQSELDREIRILCEGGVGPLARAAAVLRDRRDVYLRAVAAGGIPDPNFALELLGSPRELDVAILVALRTLRSEPEDEESRAIIDVAAAYFEMALYGPRNRPAESNDA